MRLDVRYLEFESEKCKKCGRKAKTKSTWFYFPFGRIGIAYLLYKKQWNPLNDEDGGWIKATTSITPEGRFAIIKTVLKTPILVESCQALWSIEKIPILYTYSRNCLLYFEESRFYRRDWGATHNTYITAIASPEEANTLLDKFIDLIIKNKQVFSTFPKQIEL